MKIVKRVLMTAGLLAGCLGATYVAATLALMRPDSWRIDVALASHLAVDYSRDPHDAPMRAPLDPAVADAASADEQVLLDPSATATRIARPGQTGASATPALDVTPAPSLEPTRDTAATKTPKPTKTSEPHETATPRPVPTGTPEPKPTKTPTPIACKGGLIIIIEEDGDDHECASPTPRPTKTPLPEPTKIVVDCDLYPDEDICEDLATPIIID